MNLSPISAKTKGTPVPNPPQNHLGRPRQVRDDNNQLVWQLTPTDFGGLVDKALQDKTGYTLNLRFTGQYFDKDTGLYYNHHRYYDPKTGRYITPDPLGLAGGNNLYTYVNNSPVHYNDPVGLLLFAFDGTGNRDYADKKWFGLSDKYKDLSKSNVVKFRDLYKRDPYEPNFPNTTWKYATVDSKWFGLGKTNINLKSQIKPFSTEMQNNNVFYTSGAGTTDNNTGIKGVPLFDGGTGFSIVHRVDAMVGYLYGYLDKVYQNQWDEKGNYKQKDKPININLDIVGFSRGAASARMFSSKVEEIMKTGKWYGIDKTMLGGKQSAHLDWRYTTKFLQECGINFKFNFMGLWDTVPAFGLKQDNDMQNTENFNMDLDVSGSDFNTIVYAVATNENRKQFARRSIYTRESQANNNNGIEQSSGKYRLEKGFLGAHSDIGGGYKSGDLSKSTFKQ